MPALKLNSRRTDVAPGLPDQVIEPAALASYYQAQNENIQPAQQQAADLLQQILK